LLRTSDNESKIFSVCVKEPFIYLSLISMIFGTANAMNAYWHQLRHRLSSHPDLTSRQRWTYGPISVKRGSALPVTETYTEEVAPWALGFFTVLVNPITIYVASRSAVSVTARQRG
jgi:hypothetical protein